MTPPLTPQQQQQQQQPAYNPFADLPPTRKRHRAHRFPPQPPTDDPRPPGEGSGFSGFTGLAGQFPPQQPSASSPSPPEAAALELDWDARHVLLQQWGLEAELSCTLGASSSRPPAAQGPAGPSRPGQQQQQPQQVRGGRVREVDGGWSRIESGGEGRM
jgi:hypothetical protein